MQNLESKKVLFLALSGIGNLVMQLPTIRALKKAYPAWEVTVWVAPRGTKEIAKTENAIDHVIEMPIKASPLQHITQILKLRKEQFDIGIVLSPGQLLKSATYLKLAGIPVRIGNTYPFRNNLHSSLFLTDPVNEDPTIHDIEQNLLLLEPLSITPEPVAFYSLEVPQEHIQESKQLLPSLSSTVIGIHPGSAPGFEWKRWPLKRFANVAKELIKKNPDTTFLIFGSKDEQAQKEELVNMINDELENKVAYAISASLLTTAAAMKSCTFFLSNDSGLMHIAAAVGVPTLGLFGPTDEAQTGPRGKKSATLRLSDTTSVYNTERSYLLGNTPHESMLGITEEMVLNKIGSY